MKANFIMIVMLITISLSMTAQDYTYTRDQFDKNKVTMTNSMGRVVAYYVRDKFNQKHIDVLNGNGRNVGYFEIDAFNPDVAEFHSANGLTGNTFNIPRLTGLFNPAPIVESNPNANDNLIKNIQAIQNARSVAKPATPIENIEIQEDPRLTDLKERIKTATQRTEYLEDSIERSHPEYFNTPKAIVPFKLVIDDKEYILSTDYSCPCLSPSYDHKTEIMWCHDYNNKIFGFFKKNPTRGMDLYKVKSPALD